MKISWFGQSAFRLDGEKTVVIDPFPADSTATLASLGFKFDYPPIEDVSADLVLVTHEHSDHNGAEVILGSPSVIRSTAGRFESPVGEVVAVASEHDQAAGTERGPNAIFCFQLDGLSFCHLGDLGQSELRPAQLRAIGEPDVVMLPAGGVTTIGGVVAAAVAHALKPRLVIAMHFRTEALNFLEPPDDFLDAVDGDVQRLRSDQFEVEGLLAGRDRPTVVVPAVPR